MPPRLRCRLFLLLLRASLGAAGCLVLTTQQPASEWPVAGAPPSDLWTQGLFDGGLHGSSCPTASCSQGVGALGSALCQQGGCEACPVCQGSRGLRTPSHGGWPTGAVAVWWGSQAGRVTCLLEPRAGQFPRADVAPPWRWPPCTCREQLRSPLHPLHGALSAPSPSRWWVTAGGTAGRGPSALTTTLAMQKTIGTVYREIYTDPNRKRGRVREPRPCCGWGVSPL